MMSFEYTVKVYADAVKSGFRDIESIPDEYRKEVKVLLYKDGYKDKL